MRKPLIPVAALVTLLAVVPAAEAKRKYKITANVTDEGGSIEKCELAGGYSEYSTDETTFTFSQSGYLPGRTRVNGVRRVRSHAQTDAPNHDLPDPTDVSVPYSDVVETKAYVIKGDKSLGYTYQVGPDQPPRYLWIKYPRRVGQSVTKTFEWSYESPAAANDGCAWESEPGWIATGSVTVKRTE